MRNEAKPTYHKGKSLFLEMGLLSWWNKMALQGETAGVLKILVDLVHKGILSAADAAAEAAEKVDVTEDEFKKLL